MTRSRFVGWSESLDHEMQDELAEWTQNWPGRKRQGIGSGGLFFRLEVKLSILFVTYIDNLNENKFADDTKIDGVVYSKEDCLRLSGSRATGRVGR